MQVMSNYKLPKATIHWFIWFSLNRAVEDRQRYICIKIMEERYTSVSRFDGLGIEITSRRFLILDLQVSLR
jgi:hypothetical protein